MHKESLQALGRAAPRADVLGCYKDYMPASRHVLPVIVSGRGVVPSRESAGMLANRIVQSVRGKNLIFPSG